MEINHYTINTQHNRVSGTEDVRNETIEYLTNLIRNTNEGDPIELLDGATMELTTEQGGYVATIKVGGDVVLATAGACNKLQAKKIWKTMLKIAEPALPDKVEPFPGSATFYPRSSFPWRITAPRYFIMDRRFHKMPWTLIVRRKTKIKRR